MISRRKIKGNELTVAMQLLLRELHPSTRRVSVQDVQKLKLKGECSVTFLFALRTRH
jgi:hypothetical protein